MKLPDLNLIIALDALLEEGTVVGAARRMNLSPPAMSRTLARIREQLGDPILIKVGRKMVPTPRALALREQVQLTLNSAVSLLQPQDDLDLAQLSRTFTLHANDVFISAFGADLLSRLRQEAPNVGLRFTPESGSDENCLRDGKVDLYISELARSRIDTAQANVARDTATLKAAREKTAILGAECERAAGELNKARATLEMAELNLSYTKIVAPIDGWVGKRAARVGVGQCQR